MAVTYTKSAPSGVASKYQGSFGAANSNVFAIQSEGSTGRSVMFKVTAAGTYTTGGDALSLSDLPISSVTCAYVVADTSAGTTQGASGATGLPEFDLSTPTAPKLKWWAGSSELTSATSITGRTLLVLLEGR